MSTTESIRTYGEVYVTVTARGPRFFYWSHRAFRLLPITREVAEASFAAGATVYRKQPGTSIWQEGGATVIGEQVTP